MRFVRRGECCKKFILAMFFVLVMSSTVRPDTLGQSPQAWGKVSLSEISELLGFDVTYPELPLHRASPELQRLFDDLKAKNDWPRQRKALLKLGALRVSNESQLETHFKRGYALKPDAVIAGNFDDDPETEYVVLFPFLHAYPSQLIYIDETFANQKPIMYKFPYMYGSRCLVRDVNGDGRQDFIMDAEQQIGTGASYEFLLIFNLVDGEIKPLFRLTLRCHFSQLIPGADRVDMLKERFDASSFTPGDLRDFVVLRRYERSRELVERHPHFKGDGGWSVGVNEKLRYSWDAAERRYAVRRSERTITSSRDPRSKDSMPYPREHYEAMEKHCNDSGTWSYKRVP